MARLPKIVRGARRGLLGRLVANGAAQIGLLVLTAWLVKHTFDRFVAGAPPAAQLAELAGYAAALVVAAIGAALLRRLEHVDAERLGQDYTHEVRMALFRHMGQACPRSLKRRTRGGVMLRFIGDLTALKQWVSLGLARLTVAGVTSAGALAVLAVLSGPLALIVAMVLAAAGVLAFALGARLEAATREARRRRTRLAANVTAKIGSLGVVHAYGQLEREQRVVTRQSADLQAAMVSRARAAGALRALAELAGALASAGALMVGAWLVLRGAVTPGTVVAAMSIVGMLVPALRDLGRVQEYWHGAAVSREKIRDFLAIPPLLAHTPCGDGALAGPGRLEFRDIYVSGALHGVNAVAAAGATIGIVGPNGSGKSTLLALAARQLMPSRGTVVLDGHELGTINTASLNEAVSIMGPDLPLLRGTVAKNLRYRRPDATEQELAQARALCGIDELLAGLPQGEQTRLGEDGVNLSLGQRQRIALARALLGQPKVLLLDEADANLDAQSGAALRRVLTEYRGTVLFVTHRLDWAALADTVWHIADGRLVEAGPLAELLQRNGPTTQLFRRPALSAIG